MSEQKPTENTIYDLGLGEVFHLSDTFFMRRIPGGWIATEASYSERINKETNRYDVEKIFSSCFIPFSAEFHPDVVKTRELAEKPREKMK